MKKKLKLILGIIVAIITLAACSTYSCPTYSDATPVKRAKMGVNPIKPVTYREYVPLAYKKESFGRKY